ncbi:hypothetical protein B0H67DRAFT_640305 [Lasiosphaeris hirsuta]|uniref:DUF7791 domain-containing protein n=1 Tax=Lasiosphaeris hirsuta TaxID=260670 RepID=A0AA40EBB9_9PEZI|nr:hypothetical protein B0H67DRAFT_640305 [Lasiosphaeris hirsuta]
MWKEVLGDHRGLVDVGLPSQVEMMHAFSFIGRNQDTIGGRFCILIDSLDEVAGDYMDGIAFINDSPGLRLQDLNHGDISAYVNETIGKHGYMSDILRSSTECESMIQDIIDKASSSVFLWVVLACRSLLSGFANHDDMSELRRRVDELLPELEELFQQLSHQAQFNLCTELEGRLRSRCGGLLEASRDTTGQMPCLSSTRCRFHNPRCINFRVAFMHRTVFRVPQRALYLGTRLSQPPTEI